MDILGLIEKNEKMCMMNAIHLRDWVVDKIYGINWGDT